MQTPGPWSYIPYGDAFDVHREANKERIAIVSTEADASLIAAAPELAASLQDILAEYIDLLGVLGFEEEAYGDVRQAKAVLTKALGDRE